MTEREELEMWRKMYMRLLRGVEDSIDILVHAERECEDLYINTDHTYQEYNSETMEASGVKWQFCEIIGEPHRRGFMVIPRSTDT